MNPTKLTAWVRGMQGERLAGWALRQLYEARGREEQAPVASWPADAPPELVVAQALASAREDADDTGGLCRYALVSLDDEGRMIQRKTFRVAGEALSDDAAPAEAPDSRGLLAQLMRHTEARERINHGTQGELLTHYKETIADLRARVRELEGREFDNIRIGAELLQQQAKGQIEQAKEAFAIDVKRRAVAKLETLVPILANKLAGRPLLPEGKGASPLEALVATLEPEQLEGIAGTLKPEQLAGFLEILSELNERRAKETTPSPAVAAE